MWKKSILVSTLSLSVLSAAVIPTTIATSALFASSSATACSFTNPCGDLEINLGSGSGGSSGKIPDNSPVIACLLGPGEYELCTTTEEESDCGGIITSISSPEVHEMTAQQCSILGGQEYHPIYM